MERSEQICPMCKTGLKFRGWSNRYPKQSRYREALAICPAGCGKFAIRYFDGVPTCEPYQVASPAKKTCRGSYKVEPKRKAEIVALYGSVQNFLDIAPLVGMSLQYKT